MKKMFNLESKFTKFMMFLVDILLINVLFIIFSLPIFTIGASATALYTLTLRIVRGEHQYVFKSFYQSFKKNFKQATLLWLVVLFGLIILYANLSFIQYLSGILYLIFSVFLILVSFLFGSMLVLLFPTLARYDNTVKKTLFNALKLALMNPIILIILWVISYGPILLAVLTPFYLLTAIYIVTFGGFALLALFQSLFIQRIFNKLDNKSNDL